MNTIKLGSKGIEVKTLQGKLNLLVDGVFGTVTQEAVKNFQKNNNLVVDGIVGPKTWEKLELYKQSKRAIKEVIIHCSATAEGKDYTINDIKKWHLARGFSDIGYHYVIYRDGSVHIGRNVDISGAHCTGHNSNSIGICYIGGVTSDGKTAKDTRTEAQKKALVNIVKDIITKYHLTLDKVYGHYQFANKACPSFKIEPFRLECK